MIDRRFLDVSITVNGFAESVPKNPADGDQWIVSKAWGNSYPRAVVDSIATYKYNKGWQFTMPNSISSALEVINIATQEILKYVLTNTSSNISEWKTVASLGGLVYSYIVDKVYDNTAPENTIDKVGEVYIVANLDGDSNVYKITGEGTRTLKTLSVGEKVAVIEKGYVYKVASKTVEDAEVKYFSWPNNGYAPINSLVHSLATQTVYLSPASTGNDLISLTPQVNTAGENKGTLTMVAHTFTAEEVQNKTVTLSDKIDSTNLNSVMCFIAGTACRAGVDFNAKLVNNSTSSSSRDERLQINGLYTGHSWNSNFPSENEVGIFMFLKK